MEELAIRQRLAELHEAVRSSSFLGLKSSSSQALAMLAKPGRDPRRKFENVSFAQGVETIDDLQTGMRLPGIVTNVTAFGAFVDVGVHQDGLVHISEMADYFVKDPHQVVRVRQQVWVTVLSVDVERKRIALSLKEDKGKHDKRHIESDNEARGSGEPKVE